MEADPGKRKQIIWQIERILAEAGVRPVLYCPAGASCWEPRVKELTLMTNSIYNGWRMEDVWLAFSHVGVRSNVSPRWPNVAG
jgi:peptide/nickel transport system substrate-binding protein